MAPKPCDMRLTGARVLRDGELQRRSVVVRQGVIGKGPLPEVDLSGYLVLPGIIDLHGDAFERHIAPRPSAPFPLLDGLAATDRDAASNGITTAWLAQSWSWEGGHRAPDQAEALAQALAAYRPRMQTDLRLQIRCETHLTDSAERLLTLIDTHDIDYVVFNNHLDDALDAAQTRPATLARWAEEARRSPQQHLAALRAAKKNATYVPRFLCRLAEGFDRRGVLYGSHDDPDAETRETYSMIGAKICEFPVTRAAARLATAVGDPVLMGAPNVVRGGSQAGNAAAEDLIEAGHCDALVSDYHYPSLARAAFALVDKGLRTLPSAWALISSTPAHIMRLPDRGEIDYGRRADLVVVNEATRQIEATLCAGRITHLAGEAATRFFGAGTELAMAAE
ncbi:MULTISPECIES: alpha-D-ribose 1-methylphosphonate 5-triphosphate diphosphatase [unclassified Roseovarius]|uniref:alpha-D-ribose 1-methylphosphonate 5-triphosphate diphosphatase n=1 Tax=unclassified Roseovarius TaxID=2614913 RepID=UPI00273F4A1C|nr:MULTISPECIES: alpha-D-ribose 1-methylphosphonate 5-triphosphate diphosphatase [unclassified Roseovarius]